MLYSIETRKKNFTAVSTSSLWKVPHLHSHLEVIYLAEGSSVVVLDNQEYLLKEGDLFISFPNQIHYYYDREKISGYVMIFAPELLRDLKDVFYTKIPTSPILNKEFLPENIAEILEKISVLLSEDKSLNYVAAKGYLLSLMAEVLSTMTLEESPKDSDTIKRILSYCAENYTEPLSLEMLSKKLFLNKYYISHIIKERLNMSFRDFINYLRVEHACSLLEKGSNITDVAYASGFGCPRTFNRAFLKHMDQTPREYRKGK